MQQTINLTFPKSWSELTDKQLLFLFTLLADGYPAADIKVKCLLKWTGTKVIGCIEGKLFMCKLVPCDNLYEIDLTRIDEVKEWFESRHKDRERNFGKRPYYSCSMLGLPVFLITENNIISRAEKVSEERYAYCKAQYDHWQKSKAAFMRMNLENCKVIRRPSWTKKSLKP